MMGVIKTTADNLWKKKQKYLISVIQMMIWLHYREITHDFLSIYFRNTYFFPFCAIQNIRLSDTKKLFLPTRNIRFDGEFGKSAFFSMRCYFFLFFFHLLMKRDKIKFAINMKEFMTDRKKTNIIAGKQ